MMNSLVMALLVVALGAQASSPKPQASWKEATSGYTYSFPRDHASHPDYKIEWWYYTGNVKAKDGRRFGYQVTFFRVGVDAKPANPSKWAVRDLFMTHLAISDPSGKRYRYAEKLSRGGPGWLAPRPMDTTCGIGRSGRRLLTATSMCLKPPASVEAGL